MELCDRHHAIQISSNNGYATQGIRMCADDLPIYIRTRRISSIESDIILYNYHLRLWFRERKKCNFSPGFASTINFRFEATLDDVMLLHILVASPLIFPPFSHFSLEFFSSHFAFAFISVSIFFPVFALTHFAHIPKKNNVKSSTVWPLPAHVCILYFMHTMHLSKPPDLVSVWKCLSERASEVKLRLQR